MRKLSVIWIVILLTVTACVDHTIPRVTTTPEPPQVDLYRGTPPATSEADDPLHEPVIQGRSIAGNGIRCDLDNNGTCNNADRVLLNADIQATANAPKTATPKPTVRPTATKAPTIAPSATTGPTSTPLPTATDVPPSEAPCLNCIDPAKRAPVPNPIPDLRGKPCADWVHDLYVTIGPNGRMYRTFHLPVQPEGQPGAGCDFDHSHGSRDIHLSHANSLDPAYGYEADVAGMSEPHAGFKTEYANRGECNALENFCATSDTRVTVHMGTAGKGRLTVQMHTFAYDLVGDKGTIVHVRGMGDTGSVSTQCEKEPDTSVHGFRLVAMPKDQATACSITSPYEVWEFHLRYGDTTVASKFATFDGITTARKQADGSYVLEPTGSTWDNAPFSGCTSDVYFGGGYYANEVDETDVFGPQTVIFGSDNGKVVLDTSEFHKNTYKAPAHGCGPEPYTNN